MASRDATWEPADRVDDVEVETGDIADVTTVLVVEDNAELRGYIRRHLEPDYRVIEAADGGAGLAAARAHVPDLILSDVMMPGIDGLALVRALRNDRETDFIPVVLLTARAAPADRLDGLGEGAEAYLTKPFDPEDLRLSVGNLIAGRQRLRERLALASPASTPPAAPLSASPVPPSADEAFLANVHAAVAAHMSEDDFTVGRLAAAVGVSRGHLHRQLAELTGRKPSALIRETRLARAAELLAARAGTVAEVAYAVGFRSASHFSNRFAEAYGHRPSAHVAKARAET